MAAVHIGSSELWEMLQATSAAWKVSRIESDTLDRYLGDGDHGSALSEAFFAAIDDLSSEESVSSLLQETSFQLMNKMGGAAGALFGSFFLGMSISCRGKTALDTVQLAEACEVGCRSVQRRSKAEIGDKTLLDALIPAVLALKNQEDSSILLALRAAADAAQKGALSTIPLQAQHGRAKFLGPRSSGHMDPGAHSVSVMFVAWRDYWAQLTDGKE